MSRAYIKIPHSNNGVSFIFEQIDEEHQKTWSAHKHKAISRSLNIFKISMANISHILSKCWKEKRIVWGQTNDAYVDRPLPVVFYLKLFHMLYTAPKTAITSLGDFLVCASVSKYKVAGIIFTDSKVETIRFKFMHPNSKAIYIDYKKGSENLEFYIGTDVSDKAACVTLIESAADAGEYIPDRPTLGQEVRYTDAELVAMFGIPAEKTNYILRSSISNVPINILKLNIHSLRATHVFPYFMNTDNIIMKSHLSIRTDSSDSLFKTVRHYAEFDVFSEVTKEVIDTVYILDNDIILLSDFDSIFGNLVKPEIVENIESSVGVVDYIMHEDKLYYSIEDKDNNSPEIQYTGGLVTFEIKDLFKK